MRFKSWLQKSPHEPVSTEGRRVPPLKGDWLDELSEESLRKAAQITLDLLGDPRRWIHRRVERIEFKDENSARHRISVDFTLPSETQSVAELYGVPVYLAPLFIVVKDHPNPRREPTAGSALAAYSDLDLEDEDGKSLPLSLDPPFSETGIVRG